MGEGKNHPGAETPLSLLERARRHDPAAWERLVALYRPLVLFWCRRGGMQGADAEDIGQEVFAAAAAGLDHFHHDQPGDTFRG
jgi:RNA polymerase sigma-70 factor (ECF subfamily)